MSEKETLKLKAYHLWRAAALPDFLNHKGPKWTPAWEVYACHLEYTAHVTSWREAARFMSAYYDIRRHFTTWQKAIAKWPQYVWDALAKASAGDDPCDIAAIDGTTMSSSNPSQHYLKRIGRVDAINRPVQDVVMVNVLRRKFLSWRIRMTPRGEKCDVRYLIRKSPVTPELALMDKGFDSDPLHAWLRDNKIYSIAPVRKNCKRGRYRKEMRDFFDYGLYWQRNLVESLISAVKRVYGSHVRARTARMKRAEVHSKFICYNISSLIVAYFLLSHANQNL